MVERWSEFPKDLVRCQVCTSVLGESQVNRTTRNIAAPITKLPIHIFRALNISSLFSARLALIIANTCSIVTSWTGGVCRGLRGRKLRNSLFEQLYARSVLLNLLQILDRLTIDINAKADQSNRQSDKRNDDTNSDVPPGSDFLSHFRKGASKNVAWMVFESLQRLLAVKHIRLTVHIYAISWGRLTQNRFPIDFAIVGKESCRLFEINRCEFLSSLDDDVEVSEVI